jgi:hypothetical protein
LRHHPINEHVDRNKQDTVHGSPGTIARKRK